MHQILQSKKLRFGAIGGINTALDLGIFTLLVHVGLLALVSNTISTSVGMLSSFLLNRRFTFKAHEGAKQSTQIIKFLVITLIGLWILQPLIIYGFVFVSDHLLHIDSRTLQYTIGKCISIGASLIWNYCWYNNYVFKVKPADE